MAWCAASSILQRGSNDPRQYQHFDLVLRRSLRRRRDRRRVHDAAPQAITANPWCPSRPAQPDQIVEVRTKTRHTTVLVLPRGENILDFVVGDSEYWHLSGRPISAYLKPLDEKVQTNVALICESGAIYSFLVKEAPDPHLVVRIEAGRGSAPTGRPAFVARSAVEDYREMARAPVRPPGRPGKPPIFDLLTPSLKPPRRSTGSRQTTPAGCPSPTNLTRGSRVAFPG